MVLLTVSTAARAAIEDYCKLSLSAEVDGNDEGAHLQNINIGDPIDHETLCKISNSLVEHGKLDNIAVVQWRLDHLLKGARPYYPPPPQKPEPTAEYKALMQRLRKEEEQRQYERMLNPAPGQDTFSQRFPTSIASVGSSGQNQKDDIDEVSYADVNRQMILIINVLISIICCSVAIWIAARRWSVPQRLGLSFSGSTIVAVAEVAIYMGYIKRIKDAKTAEVRRPEKKEILNTWVIDAKKDNSKTLDIKADPSPQTTENLRFRKGKHR